MNEPSASSSYNLLPNGWHAHVSTVSSTAGLGLSQRELSSDLPSTLRFHMFVSTQQSVGPSLSTRPFGQGDTMARGHSPKPFVLTSFKSTITHSDSWHRIDRNFAFAYIRIYLPMASGRCLYSLLLTLSSVSVTISRPYLPFGRYQASLGHTRFFPTVSPAHTLVRWTGTHAPSPS